MKECPKKLQTFNLAYSIINVNRQVTLFIGITCLLFNFTYIIIYIIYLFNIYIINNQQISNHTIFIIDYYLSSTSAPLSSSSFLIFSASSFEIFSFTKLGAPSTRSLASLRPSPVIALTTLIT